LNFIQRLASCYTADKEKLETVIDKLGPAISVLWNTRKQHDVIVTAFEFGKQAKAPSLSVIVPLDLPLDFMRFQLSQFADDADWENGELIFVLDDAGLQEDLLLWCDQLESIFKIPFKVLISSINLGYARASTLAAEHARGPLLLLLHSDVIPTAKGWLHTLINAYAELPNVGVLGARLLEQDERAEALRPLPLKVPSPERSLPQIKVIRERSSNLGAAPTAHVVATMSGACLMVGRALFFELGGLDDDFIMGMFSDADFCRKVNSSGKINYQLKAVALYHLKQRTRYSLENAYACHFIIAYNRWLSAQRPIGSVYSYPLNATGLEHGEWYAYPCH
jgi:GT2 family glycosyltransferase